MNPETQRIAIALHCGWEFKHIKKGPYSLEGYAIEHKGEKLGQFDLCRGWDHCFSVFRVPDYCNDLNAMHEAEKSLTREQLVDYCNFRLRFVTGEGMCEDYKMICSTAAQRAEAFLRTIGKWEES